MKRAVPALTLLASLCICACGPRENEVSRAIGSAARASGATEVHLTRVTAFEWDKVYLFAPYMPRAEVCETLAVQPKYCERLVPFESLDDGTMTLAFLQGSRVVHYARHARWNGDFMPGPAQQPIAAAQASFRVVPAGLASDGTLWIRLVLAGGS